jgi:hypothetical protein
VSHKLFIITFFGVCKRLEPSTWVIGLQANQLCHHPVVMGIENNCTDSIPFWSLDKWAGGKMFRERQRLSANIRDKLGACAANLSIFLPRPVTSRQSSVSGVAGFATPKSGCAAAALPCRCPTPKFSSPGHQPPSSRAHVPSRLEFVSEEVVAVALPCAPPEAQISPCSRVEFFFCR